MGDADLGAIEISNNSFHATTSLEMDGHAIEAEVSAKFDGEHAEGFLKLDEFTRTAIQRHQRSRGFISPIGPI